jgi:chromosome segregation ATPase
MGLTETGAVEARQQIERWIEESQLLLGRIIPSVLEDHQRLRDRLGVAEQENERLREEVALLRRELTTLQGDLGALRGQHEELKAEQSAVAETLARALHHLGQLLQPMQELGARLRVAPGVGLEGVLR